MKEILFHICCGPCATASIKKLQAEGYQITGFYYNPNIFPKSEYLKRLKEAKKFADDLNFELIVPEYKPIEYSKAVRGSIDSQKERCPKCWSLRLSETAKQAGKSGIGEIGTTLRISPYQDQEKLLKIGRAVAAKYDLKFYESELVGCFRESVEISVRRGMYRQKYCGCRYSREYR